MDAQHSSWSLTLDEPAGAMAVHLCSMRLLPYLFMLLIALLPALNCILITDEEATLLAETHQDILCFSRTFMDLTCFWDESAQVEWAYSFFYTYKGDSSRECQLTSLKQSAGDWRHVCIFPTGHLSIQLFIDLHVEVLDTVNNHTRLFRHLSVEAVGLIAPPVNVTAEWPRVARQLHVTWLPPPINYKDFLIYEVAYGVEGSSQPSSRAEAKNQQAYLLTDLLPGQRYHIRVRTKPDGISFDGLWGPWSPAVLAETPHLPEEIGLQCFTPDLHQLHCQWNWEPLQPGSSDSLLYWAEDNSISARTQAWHMCEDEERTKLHYDPNSHICILQPSNTTYISVLVTVTQGQTQHVVNFFKEPFELYHVVRTVPPRIMQANVDRGMLKLEWVPPLEELTTHMMYHIRYEAENSQNWKELQVQYSNNSEIHLTTGGRYCLQLRTQPTGERFRGSWSAWSECECVDVPPGAGSTILPVAVALLLCGALVLGLGCTCFSMYSSMKQKLWPPIPDLHHVLDGFLEDNSKQQQQVNAFFCNKILEDTPLTCLLEVLPETPLETPNYAPLPNTMPVEQGEWDSQPFSHQHYMVLSPNNSQGNHSANEYFDGKDDGCDTLPMPLEYGPNTTSEPEVQLGSFPSFSTPPSVLKSKGEADREACEELSIPPTHISNQSYLLMG